MILRFTGSRIHYKRVECKRKPDNVLQIGSDTYIDLRAPGVYGNHSCTPNAGVTPGLRLVAIKAIRKGQEITYDYSTTMDRWTECSFRCACVSPACRRIIRGYSKLRAALRKKYRKLDVVQRFLIRERT